MWPVDYAERVKMSDVAKRAGVSIATVSKVVNSRYGVAPGTVARVQAIIDEMGYVENLSASSLRRGRSNVLGILVATFEPFSTELLKGAARVADIAGYEVLAHTGGDAHAWERRSLSRLGGTLMDGAIIVTPTVLQGSVEIPAVAIDPHYGPSSLHTIDADSFEGARLVTKHLIDLGHTRIALLGGRAELDSARLREAGYRAALADAGIAVEEELVRETRYRPEVAVTEANVLLDMDDPPTAIFAANDITALETLRIARERGVDVPGELSVVGFDDVPEAALSEPPLTTVRQPLQAMGEAAMHMLIDLVEGRTREEHIRFDTTLVVRASTAPPRG